MSSQLSIPTVDRISVLPDSVICHILSFLPTKESAATSILSKRWNPLWLSVLTLDFDDQNFTKFATFRHFVYSVITLRNITQTIQSFRLKWGNSSGFNPHDFKRFIHAVFQRGVQNLNLEMTHFKPDLKLPHCVFSCSNLTALKLRGLAIDFSCDFNFPLLKTLHLYTISFGRDRNCFLRLLKGCPILEDLETKDLMLHSSNTGMYASLFNVYSAHKHQLPTFHNLTHMKIVFELTHIWPEKWKWLIEVLQHCPKLQNLIIHEGLSGGNEIGDVDWMDTPIVPECLSSQLKTCTLIGYKGGNCDFQFAKYILKNAKVLQTMTINASPSEAGPETGGTTSTATGDWAGGESEKVGGASEVFGDSASATGADAFVDSFADDFGDEAGASAAIATPTTATKMSARANTLEAIVVIVVIVLLLCVCVVSISLMKQY